MTVTEFCMERMSAYAGGGLNYETAALYTRGELSALLSGNHWTGGQQTPPPTTTHPEGALKEGEAVLSSIRATYQEAPPQEAIERPTAPATAQRVDFTGEAPESPPMARYEGLQALEYMAAHKIPLIGAYIGGDRDGRMIGKETPENFTTDPREIVALMEGKGNRHGLARGTAIERFYFIPAETGLLCLDIDRKPGKPDGLQELYRLFPRDTLPRELANIDRFPCHVTTPSGGYHLYFRYDGPPIKKTDLAPEVEVKHGRPGLTAPGSRKGNGSYILHGELEDAPPLYGIIIDRIADLQKQKEAARAEPQPAAAAIPRPSPAAPRRTGGNPGRQWEPRPRITLDTLAEEATRAAGGNHDRQVSFAGRACRCKFSFSEALAYVQANPAIFGTGADTENTIKSVYHDRGAL